MRLRHKGFTLIELMIVIAIIGIIVAAAIPMYVNYVVRSQIAEGLNVASGAKAAAAEYFQEHGFFPADNAEAGLSPAGNIQGNYVASVSVSGDEIAVLYGNDANAQILGQTVTLKAADNIGSVIWTCASGGVIQDKHLPAACR